MRCLSSWREETPAAGTLAYLDNAGCSPSPRPVLDAVHQQLELEAAIGGYRAESAQRTKIEDMYTGAARLLNCSGDDLALFGSATEAWLTGVRSISFPAGSRILISQAEYGSHLAAYPQLAAAYGIRVQVIPNDPAGAVDLGALDDLMDDDVALVALPYISSNCGVVNPIAEAGQIVSSWDTLFAVDACQAVGQVPVDFGELNCDLLTFAGRKFLRGPRGTAIMVATHKFLSRSTWTSQSLRSHARSFEYKERSVANQVGLGKAISLAQSYNVDETSQRICELSAIVRAELAGMAAVTVVDRGHRGCGIVAFNIDQVSAKEVKRSLSNLGVIVATSPAANTPLDMASRGLSSVVRISVHYYNDDRDICRLLDGVKVIARAVQL